MNQFDQDKLDDKKYAPLSFDHQFYDAIAIWFFVLAVMVGLMLVCLV